MMKLLVYCLPAVIWSNCFESNYLLVLFHKTWVWLCVLVAWYDIFYSIYCSHFDAFSICKLCNYSIELDGFTFRNGSLPHEMKHWTNSLYSLCFAARFNPIGSLYFLANWFSPKNKLILVLLSVMIDEACKV